MAFDAGSGAVTDDDLLAMYAAGDRAAARVLAGRLLPRVLAYAARLLGGDRAEAEDVAQEAILRLWRNASGLELGPGGFKPWLRRVVTNLCIDRVRAARHLTVVEEVPEETEPAHQLEVLVDRDLSKRVDEALRALPDRQRQALTLFHFEGLSQSEVGVTLGISDEAVESLLARGRRSLKAALKEEWRDLLPGGGDAA